MKKKASKLVPKIVKRILNRMYNKRALIRYLIKDYQRYSSNSFGMTNRITKDHLRAMITINYHSIEKGLCQPQLRYGFGKSAMTKLIFALKRYEKMGYNLNDKRYQSGLSVIKNYIEIHTKAEKPILNVIEQNLDLLSNLHNITGGIKKIHEKLSTQNLYNLDDRASLEKYIKNRSSTRIFGTQSIPEIDIKDALKLASNTPSVCNRQPWKVIVIKDFNIISDVLNIQNGFHGFEKNVQYLVVILQDYSYLSGPKEKDQGMFDTGLFTMNLVYSLQTKNIASCIINSQLTIAEEKKVRKLLKFDYSNKISCFIAVGSYTKEYLIAWSEKDNYQDFTKFI